MDARTKEALETSIAHHERNMGATSPNEVRLGSSECELCVLYLDKNCRGCPVNDYTRKRSCVGTPYHDVTYIYDGWIGSPTDNEKRDAYRAAEQAEIDFLKSLRPKE